MNAAHLRLQAFERFIVLLVNKRRGDTRSVEQLRQAAAREVVREARLAARAEPSNFTTINPNSPFDLLFARISAIAARMNWHAEQRNKPAPAPKAEPRIEHNPVVCIDPPAAANVLPFPAPLVVTGSRSAQLLADGEFPARYHDRTTRNWRESIARNAEIGKQREAASAARRNSPSKYVG
jgi:hypothetical protein